MNRPNEKASTPTTSEAKKWGFVGRECNGLERTLVPTTACLFHRQEERTRPVMMGRTRKRPRCPCPLYLRLSFFLSSSLTHRGRIVSMFKRKSAPMRSMSANERSLALLLEELKKDQSTLAALAKRKETIQNELKTLGTRPPEPFTFDASSRCHYSLPIRHPITGDTPSKR